MVASFPRGIYRMAERMSIISENSGKYRRSSKKVRGQILDELTHILGMNRKYLAYLLRNAGREVYTRHGVRVVADPRVSYLSKRGRKKVYTEDILPYLVLIWTLAGYVSSIHLVAFIRVNRDKVFAHPKLKAAPGGIRKRLLTISHATVDRMLKGTKEKLTLKGRYKPNPHASCIKKSVPVQAYHEKPTDCFGYIEMDLVHHCGETTQGEHAFTLNATEITAGWTELRAIKNKARIWTIKALEDIEASVPFPLTHLHSDNGSEFVNSHTVAFAKKRGIPFTRSRKYRKNDAPFVESKNWSMVRVYTGYARYDTEEELVILQQLMRLVSLKHNYFMPTMKLVDKHRNGGKVRRRYNIDTPLNRGLASDKLTDEKKRELIAIRDSIDLLKLLTQIESLQDQLDQAYRHKYNHVRGRRRCL